MGLRVRLGFVCPCPLVPNNIVTLCHLFIKLKHALCRSRCTKNISSPTRSEMLPSDVISRHLPSSKNIFDAKLVIYVKNGVKKGAQCRFSL